MRRRRAKGRRKGGRGKIEGGKRERGMEGGERERERTEVREIERSK